MSPYLIIAILGLAALKRRHRRRFSTVDVDKSNNIWLIRRRNLLKYKPLVEQGQILFKVKFLSKIFGCENFLSKAIFISLQKTVATATRGSLSIAIALKFIEKVLSNFLKSKAEALNKATISN